MTYEVAKQLKDAGFPQELNDPSSYYAVGYSNSPKRFGWSEGEDKPYEGEGRGFVKIPTLEELIKACGDEFVILEKDLGEGWLAKGGKFKHNEGGPDDYECSGTGSTPAEAVARLWLELNPKS